MSVCVSVHIERTEDEKNHTSVRSPFHLLISVTLTNINTDKKNMKNFVAGNKMPEKKDEGIDAKLFLTNCSPPQLPVGYDC